MNITAWRSRLGEENEKNEGRKNMTLENVIANLQGMEVTEDFVSDVICAFEDYEIKGKTEVVVSKDENDPNIDYQAYVNHPEAPIILIKVIGDKVKAWKA